LSSQPVAPVRSRAPLAAAPSDVAPLSVPESTLNRLTDVFKMMADKSRLQIVLALARDGELHVSDLCKLLRQSQPAVSHHLTLMRMVGIVDYNRVGKHNFYRLASGHVRNLLEQFFAEVGNDHRQLQFSDFALTFKPR
jgi:ArsR family transcriptional regulator, arsenate/arsenite/antimonite-responsive transcriptional repressor